MLKQIGTFWSRHFLSRKFGTSISIKCMLPSSMHFMLLWDLWGPTLQKVSNSRHSDLPWIYSSKRIVNALLPMAPALMKWIKLKQNANGVPEKMCERIFASIKSKKEKFISGEKKTYVCISNVFFDRILLISSESKRSVIKNHNESSKSRDNTHWDELPSMTH